MLSRRDVLKAGLLIPVLGTTSPVKSKEILLLRTVVAGFRYYEGEKVWRLLQIGAELTLRREPDNPYDYRAVEIYWRKHKLGYVPRVDNSVIAQLMDRGEQLTCRIADLKESLNPWERIGIEIFLKV